MEEQRTRVAGYADFSTRTLTILVSPAALQRADRPPARRPRRSGYDQPPRRARHHMRTRTPPAILRCS
jgi:hypothetical protein